MTFGSRRVGMPNETRLTSYVSHAPFGADDEPVVVTVVVAGVVLGP
jgi:hypothetical protein